MAVSSKKKVADIRGASITAPKIPLAKDSTAPGQELSGRGVQSLSQRIDSVRKIFDTLNKTVKCYQIFLKNHTNTKNFIQQLHKEFNFFLSSEGSIKVYAKPFEFIYEKEFVYTNEDVETSLSYKFFQDGIRSLTFEKDLTLGEVEALLEIINTDFSSMEMAGEDMITLLWARKFEHLTYEVMESFKEIAKDENIINPEDLKQIIKDIKKIDASGEKTTRAVGASDQNMAAILKGPVTASSKNKIKIKKKSRVTRVLQNLDLSEFSSLMDADLNQEFVEQAMSVGGKDERKLMLIAKVRNTKLVQRFLQILIIMIREIKEGDDFLDSVDMLSYLVQYLLENEQYYWIITILFQLRDLPHISVTDDDEQGKPTKASLHSHVLNSLTSEKHIEMLFDVISNSKLDREQDSFRLMMLLSVNPIIRKEMLKRFSHIHQKGLKERIMEGLATSGNELCAEISEVLKTEESLTTQRDLINLLAMIGSDEAYEIIAANVETASIDLKMIILEALSKKQTEYAITAYLKTLTDSNENVRLKTLEYLTLYNDLKILNKVNDTVSENAFHERSLDEKRQCMMIIANNSTDLKKSYLYEIVEHSSLLKNRKFVETQAAAAMTLGILGDAKHKAFLQKHYKRLMAPKALKEACKFSIDMLSK